MKYGFLFLLFMTFLFGVSGCLNNDLTFSQQELAMINSLRLPTEMNKSHENKTYENKTYANLVHHEGNQYWNHPLAQKLGHYLFFDKRLSANGEISCAHCHQPERAFSDGKPISKGLSIAAMHTPTLIGAANSPWQYWDGRADSLWAQALGPLENPAEQGTNRMQVVHIIDRYYRELYESVFGPLPDFSDARRFPENAMPALTSPISSPPSPIHKMQPAYSEHDLTNAWESMSSQDQSLVNQVFANIGKAIAAYESLLMPGLSRFDRFATELLAGQESQILTLQEQAGLKLFISEQKGQCVRCHNGPLLTNHDFQVTGISGSEPTNGRWDGIEAAFKNPFNCFGKYADSEPTCEELRFAKRQKTELKDAFKVPTLRNISQTAPYMHNGRFESLADVIRYYNKAQLTDQLTTELAAPSMQLLRHLDIEPLRLLPFEVKQLVAFLETLDSPVTAESYWLKPPQNFPSVAVYKTMHKNKREKIN